MRSVSLPLWEGVVAGAGLRSHAALGCVVKLFTQEALGTDPAQHYQDVAAHEDEGAASRAKCQPAPVGGGGGGSWPSKLSCFGLCS